MACPDGFKYFTTTKMKKMKWKKEPNEYYAQAHGESFKANFLKLDKESTAASVVETLKEVLMNQKNMLLNIGFTTKELEGGLTFEYLNGEGKKCRCVLGYTELGEWVYVNCEFDELDKPH